MLSAWPLNPETRYAGHGPPHSGGGAQAALKQDTEAVTSYKEARRLAQAADLETLAAIATIMGARSRSSRVNGKKLKVNSMTPWSR